MYILYLYLCSLSQRVEVKEVVVPDLVLLTHKVQAGSEYVRLGVLVGDACVYIGKCIHVGVYVCVIGHSIHGSIHAVKHIIK